MKKIVFMIAIAVMIAINAYAASYEINTYTEPSDKVTSELKIALLADMHDAQFTDEIEEDLRKLQPDLILLAGDMINSDTKDLKPFFEFCEALVEIAPVYAIRGNHEAAAMKRNKGLADRLKASGVHFLRNETETMQLNGNTVQIIGMDDVSVSTWKKNGRKTMRKLPDRYEGFRICMTHTPELYHNGLEYFEYDLAVAGHVQGGVVQIPGLGGLYTPEEGFFPEISGGEYTLANNGRLIISRGLGASESWFLRINNKPELVVIRVIPGESSEQRYCEIVNAASSVNVRESPSLEAKVIATTQPGEQHILPEGGNEEWYKVRVHGAEGYIFREYVKVCEE